MSDMKSITITEETLNIKEFLCGSNYIRVNKSLIKKVGIEAAYFLTYLVEKESQFKGGLVGRDDKNWFFAESKKIENDTCLSYRNQKTAISVLEKNGLLVTKLMGIPRKLYFSIRSLNIFHFVNCINSETTTTYEAEEQIHINKDSLEERLKEGSENVQHPHPIFSPNDLETDGIEKHPTELPKASTTSKPSGGGLNLKTSNIHTPQPPDVAKVGRDMFELLRKKFPKDEMDSFLNSVDIDLPTLSNMFAEYWVFEKKRTFNKGESTGVFNSFRSWMSVAKNKEIPEKEVKAGLHTNPMLERLIPAIERKKIIKLTPQDANKVNAFIREFSPSNWALESGTKSFFDGNGKEWDHWIKAVKGAIEREKMGDI